MLILAGPAAKATTKRCYSHIICFLIVTAVAVCTAATEQLEACPNPAAGSSLPAALSLLRGPTTTYDLRADCRWQRLNDPGGAVHIVGQLQLSHSSADATGQPGVVGPPAIHCSTAASGAAAEGPPGDLLLTNVLLVNCTLLDPASAPVATQLRPESLQLSAGTGAGAKLLLQDVRILVTANMLQQHIAFFAKHISEGRVYTDHATFLHVPWWSSNTTTWQSVGLLLADAAAQARATATARTVTGSSSSSSSDSISSAAGNKARNSPGRRLLSPDSLLGDARVGGAGERLDQHLHTVEGNAATGRLLLQQPVLNYVLWADNTTLIQHLLTAAAPATSRPLLLYLGSNVTLGADLVPYKGVAINRHVFWVGMSSCNTSVDLDMSVNQLVLTGQWSNLTSDHLVFENLAPGNAKSAEIARPVTISLPSNFWFLYFPRTEFRHATMNCTVVLSQATEIDYMLYFTAVFHSRLSIFKAENDFLRNVMGTSVMEAMVVQPGISARVIAVSSHPAASFDTLYTIRPVVAPVLPAPAPVTSMSSSSNRISPLVEAVTSSSSLQGVLTSVAAPLQRPRVALLVTNLSLPLFKSPWPVQCSRTVLGIWEGNVTATGPQDFCVDLDFKHQTNVISLPAAAPASSSNSSSLTYQPSASPCLTLQHVELHGLSQGPSAKSAKSISEPDVWTMMLWAVARPLTGSAPLLLLEAVSLVLPAQEFDYLSQQFANSNNVILAMSGRGNDIILTSGSVASSTQLTVGGLQGPGLLGTNLTLERGAASEPPAEYYWPGLAAASSSTGQRVSAAAAVGALVGAVAGLLLALALAAVWYVRSHGCQCCLSPEGGAAAAAAANAKAQRSCGDLEAARPLPVANRDYDRGSNELIHNSGASSKDTAQHRDQHRHADVDQGLEPSLSHLAGTEQHQGPLHLQVDSSRCHQEQQQQHHHRAGSSKARASTPGPTAHRWKVHLAISRLAQSMQQHRLRRDHLAAAGAPGSSKAAPAGCPTCSADTSTTARATSSSSSSSSGSGSGSSSPPQHDAIQVLGVVGRGSSGTVYKALWRGRVVAVKLLHVPAVEVVQPLSPPSGPNGARQLTPDSLQAMRTRMALMEAAISTSIRHPNIVQVFSYTLQPLSQHRRSEVARAADPQLQQPETAAPAAGAGGGTVGSSGCQNLGWELRLLMEFCDQGTLQEALSRGQLRPPTLTPATSTLNPSQAAAAGALSLDMASGSISAPWSTIPSWPDLQVVLPLALDIAAALLHLHSENLIHGDLKASNVLLTQGLRDPLAATASGGGRGAAAGPGAWGGGAAVQGSRAATAAQPGQVVGGYPGQVAGGPRFSWDSRLVAKVADFGLGLLLEPEASHISHMHGGTLSHMAPELLTSARASKASDTYAFGVLLFELLTGCKAWAGQQAAALPLLVVEQQQRPQWPRGAAQQLPAALKGLVESCWAQHPAERPSAAEVFQQLQDALLALERPRNTAAAASSTLQLGLANLGGPTAAAGRAMAGAAAGGAGTVAARGGASRAAGAPGVAGAGDVPPAGAGIHKAGAAANGSCTGTWSFDFKGRNA